RYFGLQCWCGAIALAHLLAEWLYAGKSLRRWPTYLVVALFGVALFGGQVLEPKLQRLHLEKYGARSTVQQRERATGAFRGWQVVLQAANVLTILGLTTYVWQVSSAGIAPR